MILEVEHDSPQTKTRLESAKTKAILSDSSKKQLSESNLTRLEEQQNKENENPLKDSEDSKEEGISTPEITGDSCHYAQVIGRLEPEGESRDTEDESDRALIVNKKMLSSPIPNGLKVLESNDNERLYNYANINIGIPYLDQNEDYIYNLSTKFFPKNDEKIENYDALYAAINKSGLPQKSPNAGALHDNVVSTDSKTQNSSQKVRILT